METFVIKEIVTVSEMARRVGLSRARFYELMRSGVFPQPSRNAKTKRPFYNREQQEQCLHVRSTHQGVNGKAVLFYVRPPQPQPRPSVKRPLTSKKNAKGKNRAKDVASRDPLIEELRHGLQQLGMVEATEKTIRAALADEYPDGHGNEQSADLLMTVFHSLKRRDSNDNVAR